MLSETRPVLRWMKLHYVLLCSSVQKVKPDMTFLFSSSQANMINTDALALNAFTATELIKIL
jgi:hypothetical protein